MEQTSEEDYVHPFKMDRRCDGMVQHNLHTLSEQGEDRAKWRFVVQSAVNTHLQ